MGIEKALLRINNIRKDFNLLYSVDKTQRNKEWYEKVHSLNNNYKKSLHEITFGKISSTFQKNKVEIDKAKNLKWLNTQESDNLMYNNKISRLRDLHPVLYLIQDNKIFFIVQTNQVAAVAKPLTDELGIDISKDYINVIDAGHGKYFANAIYVIESKNIDELPQIIENVEQNILLKNKYLNNQSDAFILSKKERAFEVFYKTLLKKVPEKFNEDVILLNDNIIIDVTFDKYIKDNIERISNYEDYRVESWTAYLKSYEPEDLTSKNDSSDI